jgi:hypothetical protein
LCKEAASAARMSPARAKRMDRMSIKEPSLGRGRGDRATTAKMTKEAQASVGTSLFETLQSDCNGV